MLQRVDDGGFSILDVSFGYLLESNASVDFVFFDADDGYYQKWFITKETNGAYILRNMGTSEVLESDGNGDVYTRSYLIGSQF